MIEFLSPEYISVLGFPIAVTGFLLWERIAVTQKQIDAINNLRDIMIKLEARLGKD